jgi:hypothetical protein
MFFVWCFSRLKHAVLVTDISNLSAYFHHLFRSSSYDRSHSLFPKKVLHRVRSSASSLSLQYPLLSLRSFSSCLRILTRLPVTSTLPSIFPSIPCFRRQFVRKIWPIQLAFLLLFHVGYSPPPWLYVTLLNFSHDLSNWSSPSFPSITFKIFPGISGLNFRSVQVSAPCKAMLQM